MIHVLFGGGFISIIFWLFIFPRLYSGFIADIRGEPRPLSRREQERRDKARAEWQAKFDEKMRQQREAAIARRLAVEQAELAEQAREQEDDRIASARYQAEAMNWEFDHPREAQLVREYHQELKEGKWPHYAGKRPDWL